MVIFHPTLTLVHSHGRCNQQQFHFQNGKTLEDLSTKSKVTNISILCPNGNLLL
jgi:hypothetical protein